MIGVRFSTQNAFRNLRNASPGVERRRRIRRGGPRINILLRRRRLRNRRPRPAQSSGMEVVCALAFAAVALGSCARQFGGSALTVTGLLPLPFALVALFGIWMSRMPAARKILWSVAPVAFTLPFLPIG